MSIPTRDQARPRQPAADTEAPGTPQTSTDPTQVGAQPRWRPSPALSLREHLATAAGAVALAIAMTWPLAAHISSRISPDLGDPIRTAWQVAWVGHGLLSNPLHVFDANAFYPHPLSLAFSDSLLGYGPAAFFGSGTVAALVRYNVIFLLIWALCFYGAYLLARELGVRRLAAVVAGAAFAYAPYRATEAGHFQVISSGAIPLALFLLVRGYRRGSVPLVLTGWLVSVWQLSLGWTLGLQYSYLLGVLAALWALHRWREHRRAAGAAQGADNGAPALTGRVLLATCLGAAAFGAVGVLQSIPYVRVSDEYPTAARSLQEVEKFSAGPAALLAAPVDNAIWGPATASLRADVKAPAESVFFPGLAIALLAALGLLAGAANPYTRRMRVGLAAGAVTCAVLALGLGLTGAGYPYRLLYDIAPGWNGVRVPGRIFTLATLFAALLAAAGAQVLLGWLRARLHGRTGWISQRGPVVVGLTGALLVAAILGEGTRQLPEHEVPQPATAEVGLRQPVLDLPTDQPNDRLWQYFSTDGFPIIANGDSTFDIPALDDLRGAMRSFPDAASVQTLRRDSIRTVVLHLDVPPLPGVSAAGGPEPPDPAQAAAKPIAGLGLTRRQVGSVVIYDVGARPRRRLTRTGPPAAVLHR